MADKILSRSEVPAELTWDLSLIYKSEDEVLADMEKLVKLTEDNVRRYKGQPKDAGLINACVDEYQLILQIATLLGNCGLFQQA